MGERSRVNEVIPQALTMDWQFSYTLNIKLLAAYFDRRVVRFLENTRFTAVRFCKNTYEIDEVRIWTLID